MRFYIPKARVFPNKKAAASIGNYQRRLKKLKAGDPLVSKSVQLGSSSDPHPCGMKLITCDRTFSSPIGRCSTRAKAEPLVGWLITDVVLYALSFVAKTERANLKGRQAEGIRSAKERGCGSALPGAAILSVVRGYLKSASRSGTRF